MISLKIIIKDFVVIEETRWAINFNRDAVYIFKVGQVEYTCLFEDIVVTEKVVEATFKAVTVITQRKNY